MIQITAGPEEDVRDRLIALEEAVAPIIGREPVWVEVGITARPEGMSREDWDRYEDIQGAVGATTYPRRAEDIGAVFVSAREIAENMMGSDYDLASLVIRVSSGTRPIRERKKKRKRRRRRKKR
jgi:hypothetical protein